MHSFTALFVALVLAVPAISAPTRTVQKFDGETTGGYIVKLKDGVAHASVLGTINATATHSWTIINGFAGHFPPEAVSALLDHPDVEYISEDGIGGVAALQNNAPWGLGRLSTPNRLTNQDWSATNFLYGFTTTGRGVDVYVVDTGIRITHEQFGGRAFWGANFIDSVNLDQFGHGTHCAGSVGARTYGVAKETRIIAVKVLGADGRGSASAFISGLNWVAQSVASTGLASVASMSLGFDAPTQAVDDAVRAIISRGIHAVIAAGNANVDAGNISPARVPEAITVAASNIADQKASFSNWGNVIDIFAPGENILSTGFVSDTATRFDSGTSMACPHVAGLVANLLVRDGYVPPATMVAKLKAMGVSGRLSGVPSNTINLLAQTV